jgi:hypothetical protein
MIPTVMMLASGHEVIGTLRPHTPEDTHYYLEFPQTIRWWRDEKRGHCYEFIPYLYGANLQTKIPVNKNHVISMMEANDDISTAYREMVDELTKMMERMVSLKRQVDEGGETLSVTPKP